MYSAIYEIGCIIWGLSNYTKPTLHRGCNGWNKLKKNERMYCIERGYEKKSQNNSLTETINSVHSTLLEYKGETRFTGNNNVV